jgi:GH18 family chitinase
MTRRSLPLLIVLTLSSLAISSTATFAATAPPKIVGYFTAWGIYDQAYTVKNIVSSGSAPLLTHLNYAFSKVAPRATGSQIVCQLGDPWADYQKTWTAAESVDGVAVPSGGALRGNFQQLKVLKARYPKLKLLISLGGWSWSQDFSDMAMTPASRTAFVKSCINTFIKGNLPRDLDAGGPGAAAGLFDGIDIDWEFPGVCELHRAAARVSTATDPRRQSEWQEISAHDRGLAESEDVRQAPTGQDPAIARFYQRHGLRHPRHLGFDDQFQRPALSIA